MLLFGLLTLPLGVMEGAGSNKQNKNNKTPQLRWVAKKKKTPTSQPADSKPASKTDDLQQPADRESVDGSSPAVVLPRSDKSVDEPEDKAPPSQKVSSPKAIVGGVVVVAVVVMILYYLLSESEEEQSMDEQGE